MAKKLSYTDNRYGIAIFENRASNGDGYFDVDKHKYVLHDVIALGEGMPPIIIPKIGDKLNYLILDDESNLYMVCISDVISCDPSFIKGIPSLIVVVQPVSYSYLPELDISEAEEFIMNERWSNANGGL